MKAAVPHEPTFGPIGGAIDGLRVGLRQARRRAVMKMLALRIEHEDRAVHVLGLRFDQAHQCVERVRQRRAARDQFQHVLLPFSELESAFAIGDVVVHADPGDVRVGRRLDRHGAHRDPAPFAARVPEPELALERRAGDEGLAPDTLHAIAIVRMHDLVHAVVAQLLERLAGEGAHRR